MSLYLLTAISNLVQWLAFVNFEKFPKVTVSNRFRFGLSDTIGRRESMEDAVIVHGQFREKDNEDLFALFGMSYSHHELFVLT